MGRNLIDYSLFKGFPQVKAFTTVKQTLPEEAKPRFTGTPALKAEQNRKKLAEVLNIDCDKLVFPGQTHTSSVFCLAEVPSEEIRDTDALVTNQHDICLCVQTADCVPVLLFDPAGNAVGAVHAGWRGTVGLIVKEVVLTLKQYFDSDPKDIRAVIGPSIGPERYEVGNEVAEAVLTHIPKPGLCLKKYPSGKYHLNLWEANRQVLLGCGLLAENIQVSGYCTYSQPEHFFSARREGFDTGRLVSGIMLLND
ncbi:MAG: peptidoglycan editing factor PgeF [Bacteroidota bacterium]